MHRSATVQVTGCLPAVTGLAAETLPETPEHLTAAGQTAAQAAAPAVIQAAAVTYPEAEILPEAAGQPAAEIHPAAEAIPAGMIQMPAAEMSAGNKPMILTLKAHS